MSKKDDKSYTAHDAALAVLKKAQEMLKKSTLAKANTAHEVEAGGEPKSEGSEAPEYLANADIESTSGTDRNEAPDQIKQAHVDTDDAEKEKKRKKYDGAMKASDDDEEKEEEIEEDQEDYGSEEEDKDDDQEDYHQKGKDVPTDKGTKHFGKSEDVEAAAKAVMGDKDLDDVLDKMPKDKRDDVLRKLREMKKMGKSKGSMMAACKSELAKCGEMERGKKMKKSESNHKDGISKVYGFLAKSYAKKADEKRMATPEEMQSLEEAKKEKKKKLKKMAGETAKAPKDMMKPQSNSSMPPVPSGKQGY